MTIKNTKKNIDYHQELLRKTIHLLSLAIPIIYIFIDKPTAIFILTPMAIIAVFIDLMSKKVESVKHLIGQLFGKMLRPHEQQTNKLILNGASWVLISAVITVLVFPKIIAVTGFIILIISDISAALIGRRFGKTAFFDKTLEGSSAFFITAVIIVFSMAYIFHAPWTFYIAGFFAAIVSTIAESCSELLNNDDNLIIPISFGLVMLFFDIFAGEIGLSYINIL